MSYDLLLGEKFAHGFAHTLWSGGVLNLDRVHRPLLGRPNGFGGHGPLATWSSHGRRIIGSGEPGQPEIAPANLLFDPISLHQPTRVSSCILCPSWDENRIRVVRARCGRSGGLSATPTIRPIPLMVSSRRSPRPRDGQLETATQNRGDGEAQP